MTRFAWILATLAACGGAKQKPASMFAHGGGTCPDPAGCSAQIDHEQHFAPPDADHGVPPENQPPNPGGDFPRAASCAMVGDNLAAIELGNYADEDQRAPIAARWAKACDKQKLTADERLCELDATDKQTMTWCAPRFAFGPGVPVVAPADCKGYLTTMHANTNGSTGAAAETRARQLEALEASCAVDRWPATFAACVRNVPEPAYLTAYCQSPTPLAHKIADRLQESANTRF